MGQFKSIIVLVLFLYWQFQDFQSSCKKTDFKEPIINRFREPSEQGFRGQYISFGDISLLTISGLSEQLRKTEFKEPIVNRFREPSKQGFMGQYISFGGISLLTLKRFSEQLGKTDFTELTLSSTKKLTSKLPLKQSLSTVMGWFWSTEKQMTKFFLHFQHGHGVYILQIWLFGFTTFFPVILILYCNAFFAF